MARITPGEAGSANVCAFLDMLSTSEGTRGLGDDGYNVIVGSLPDMVITFSNYARHPGLLVDMDGKSGGLESTAAGRYQELARNYAAYKLILKLPDFSPHSQDLLAIRQIRECNAFEAVIAGALEVAIARCRHLWASLPGAGYGQHENSFAALKTAFTDAGGRCA